MYGVRLSKVGRAARSLRAGEHQDRRKNRCGGVDEPRARLGRRPAPCRRPVLRQLSGSRSTIGAASMRGIRPAADRFHGVRAADDRPAGPAAPRRTGRPRGRAPADDRPAPSRARRSSRASSPRSWASPCTLALFPAKPGITQRQVADTVDNVLASQTPGPPRSELVFDAIQPSLVLIEIDTASRRDAQARRGDPAHRGPRQRRRRQPGRARSSRPSTSSTDATHIKVTFADGSSTGATISSRDDGQRHRRARSRRAARPARARDPRQPGRHAHRQRGLHRRQPVRPVRLAELGRRVRARPLVPGARHGPRDTRA